MYKGYLAYPLTWSNRPLRILAAAIIDYNQHTEISYSSLLATNM